MTVRFADRYTSGPTTWRAWCRHHARQQAEQEARGVWGVDAQGDLPFNYRWEHVQEVVRLALWLARETHGDYEVVEASAWLHDIRKDRPNHGLAGAAAAEQILLATDFPRWKIDGVAESIRQHVGYHRPEDAPRLEPLEAAILWDADKLSKLGVHALVVELSTAQVAPKTMQERREHCEELVYKILDRTAASMNTIPAGELAHQRYASMVRMLEAWKEEEQQAA